MAMTDESSAADKNVAITPPKGTPFNGHLVRTIVRPLLTIGATTVWCLFIWKGIEYPPEFQLAVLGAWGLWFGERAVKRIREQGQK